MRLVMIMTCMIVAVTVIMSTSEILADNLFNQKEANDSGNNDKVCQHLLWVMTMAFVAMSVIMGMRVVVPMIMRMGISSTIKMRKSVEKDVT
jgi:hypothetical protein